MEEIRNVTCLRCKNTEAKSAVIKDFFGKYILENLCPKCGLLWYADCKELDQKEKGKDEQYTT